MRLILTTLWSILMTTVFVQGQGPGNPPCDVCGYPNATVANPTANISVAFLNITGVDVLTCDQILNAGLQGLIEPLNCQAALAQPDVQALCGCTPLGVPLAPPVPIPVTPAPSAIGLQTSAPTVTPVAVLSAAPSLSAVIPTTTPVSVVSSAPAVAPVAGVPTAFPECFICGGDQTATISNPDLEVNATFLGISGITVAQCKQIVDAGIAGFISPEACDVVQKDTELQTECGCSNLGTDEPSGISTLAPTDESSDTSGGNTIGDIVSNSSRLSRLNKAIVNAGLEAALQEPNATLTLLAPTNGGFAKVDDQAYLDKLINDPNWVVHLQNVLFFHATASVILTQDILVNNTQQTTMLNAEFVVLSQNVTGTRPVYTVSYPNPTDPETTTVVDMKQRNIVAENGVVHTIDELLLPSFIGVSVNQLLSTPVSGFTIFPEFFDLAYPEGLPAGDYTVLAPVDQAFVNLGNETLDALKDPANIDLLTQIMNDHIVPGVNPSVLLTNGQTLRSLGGTPITVTIDNTTIFFNEAMVLAANLLANNGLIYAIDSVLDNEATVAPTDAQSDISTTGVPASDIPSTSPPTITESPNVNIATISPTPTLIATSPRPTTLAPISIAPSTIAPTTKAPVILSSSPTPSVIDLPPTPSPVDDIPTRAPSVRAPVRSSQKQIRTLSPTVVQRRRRRSGDNRN